MASDLTNFLATYQMHMSSKRTKKQSAYKVQESVRHFASFFKRIDIGKRWWKSIR